MKKRKLSRRGGIEGMPLQYIVIILVAALVIGMVVKMTRTVGTGLEESSQEMTDESKLAARISSATAKCELNGMLPICKCLRDETTMANHADCKCLIDVNTPC